MFLITFPGLFGHTRVSDKNGSLLHGENRNLSDYISKAIEDSDKSPVQAVYEQGVSSG